MNIQSMQDRVGKYLHFQMRLIPCILLYLFNKHLACLLSVRYCLRYQKYKYRSDGLPLKNLIQCTATTVKKEERLAILPKEAQFKSPLPKQNLPSQESTRYLRPSRRPSSDLEAHKLEEDSGGLGALATTPATSDAAIMLCAFRNKLQATSSKFLKQMLSFLLRMSTRQSCSRRETRSWATGENT